MLTFKNSELAPIINFLSDAKLKGRASRGRTKLVFVLSKKHQELVDDLKKLKEETDETEDEYTTQFNDIVNEDISVNFDEYAHFLEHLINGLYDSETDLSGQDSLIYDKILEQLEKENEKC